MQLSSSAVGVCCTVSFSNRGCHTWSDGQWSFMEGQEDRSDRCRGTSPASTHKGPPVPTIIIMRPAYTCEVEIRSKALSVYCSVLWRPRLPRQRCHAYSIINPASFGLITVRRRDSPRPVLQVSSAISANELLPYFDLADCDAFCSKETVGFPELHEVDTADRCASSNSLTPSPDIFFGIFLAHFGHVKQS